MEYAVAAIVIGIGATATMDVWAVVRRKLLGTSLPNYAMVGRWIAHMRHGQFHHHSIAASTAVRGESVIGWTAHYLIGIAFAGLLIGIWGTGWIERPTLGPALIVGLGTVVAPFLLMQPGMGAGIAASRTARPRAARMQSVVTHLVFGVGLYGTGLVLSYISTAV